MERPHSGGGVTVTKWTLSSFRRVVDILMLYKKHICSNFPPVRRRLGTKSTNAQLPQMTAATRAHQAPPPVLAPLCPVARPGCVLQLRPSVLILTLPLVIWLGYTSDSRAVPHYSHHSHSCLSSALRYPYRASNPTPTISLALDSQLSAHCPLRCPRWTDSLGDYLILMGVH